jgi:hypothetical protein
MLPTLMMHGQTQMKDSDSKMLVFVSFCFLQIIYTPCYGSTDEKGVESAAGKTGQDDK